SFGPSSDGDVKPNLAAMGENTEVFYPWGFFGGGSGTSFACPVLAGSATCLWQAHPAATNMEIKTAMQESANYFSNPNDSLGFGIPNFELAHQYLGVTETSITQNALLVFPNPVREQIRFLLTSSKQ